jgi:hypothetical protein
MVFSSTSSFSASTTNLDHQFWLLLTDIFLAKGCAKVSRKGTCGAGGSVASGG